MKVASIIIVSTVLVIALLVIGAGIAIYLQFKPNSRTFLVDNIWLMASLDGEQALYGFIRAGTHDKPYRDTLRLSFRCGDIEVNLDQTTEQQLLQLANRVSSANPESIKGGRWPDNARQLHLCDSSVRIVVSEGEVLQVVVSSRSGVPPVQVRTGRVTEWFAFPLTDEDAVSLFGTPDRINDFFRH